MKTVRVRIAVAVKEDGTYKAWAESGHDDDMAMRMVHDPSPWVAATLCFVEIERPIPPPAPKPETIHAPTIKVSP